MTTHTNHRVRARHAPAARARAHRIPPSARRAGRERGETAPDAYRGPPPAGRAAAAGAPPRAAGASAAPCARCASSRARRGPAATWTSCGALAEIDWRQPGALTPEGRILRRRLLAARGRSRRQMAEALLDLEIARLRRDLRAVMSRGGELLFTALAARARRRATWTASGSLDLPGSTRRDASTRRRCTRSASGAPAALHRGAAGPAQERRRTPRGCFKDLQERLGLLRDAIVLVGVVREPGEARLNAPDRRRCARKRGRWRGVSGETSVRHHRDLVDAHPDELVRHALEEMGYGRTAA